LLLNIQQISPLTLFLTAVSTLIDPTLAHVFLKPLTAEAATGLTKMILNPLSMSQSFIQVWPQLLIIIALAFICFALSYIIFMKQEIRST
jgi:ABC-2 type transport system permease protein